MTPVFRKDGSTLGELAGGVLTIELIKKADLRTDTHGQLSWGMEYETLSALPLKTKIVMHEPESGILYETTVGRMRDVGTYVRARDEDEVSEVLLPHLYFTRKKA